MSPFALRPIGWVRSPVCEPLDDCWGGVESRSELDETQFTAESLRGLDEFSHVTVLFLLDRVADEAIITASRRPRGREDWPQVGIFAQPGKARPNRIGVTTCRILRIEGSHLWVTELDAIDGTPVLDLKPYIEEFGPRTPVRQPEWSRELMRGYFGRMPGTRST